MSQQKGLAGKNIPVNIKTLGKNMPRLDSRKEKPKGDSGKSIGGKHR